MWKMENADTATERSVPFLGLVLASCATNESSRKYMKPSIVHEKENADSP